jgi:cytochrome c oxidase subunit 2
MAIFGSAITLYVWGYIIYFAVVFRRRKDEPLTSIGIQVHDNVKLEFWWTLIPTIIIIVLSVLSVRVWAQLQNQLGDVLTMEAIGHQFNYEFRYPNLKGSVFHEMHVPAGTPVTLHVTSTDVIHSFWVPEMRLKADMVPGLVQTLRFTPERIGKYRIICTEFCGVNHGKMYDTLSIDSQEDFQKWLAAQQRGAGLAAAGGDAIPFTQGNLDAGRVLFGQKCSACHSLGPFEQKIVGPGLGNLTRDPGHQRLVDGSIPSPANVAHILKYGYNGRQGIMPNAQANAISNLDIANLTSFILSLPAQAAK